jgi:hypothetical protein
MWGEANMLFFGVNRRISGVSRNKKGPERPEMFMVQGFSQFA